MIQAVDFFQGDRYWGVFQFEVSEVEYGEVPVFKICKSNQFIWLSSIQYSLPINEPLCPFPPSFSPE